MLGTSSFAQQGSSDDIEELSAFEVRAIAEGQERSLNQQRASANLINVVSSDSIGRFPDPNIAEALSRLPGIGIERDQGEGRYINVRGAPKEFSSVTIDGINVPASDPETRAIDLDVFASDFVAAIEVTKAIRPDQDADSIAGAVNVRSPSAFDIGGRRILGSLASSYNDNGGSNDTRASFSFANLFGDSGQLGLVFSLNYSKTRREVDNVEFEGWDRIAVGSGANQREVWVFEETNFKDYDTRRERIGGNVNIEYKPNEDTTLFLRAFASKFEDDEFRYRLRIHWDDGNLNQDTAQNGFGEWVNPRVSFQFRNRIKTDESRSISAGGTHRFNNATWDYSVALSRSKQYYPLRDELLFRRRVPAISYDFRQNFKTPEISLFTTQEHLDTDAYDFREFSKRTIDTVEDEVTVATNLEFYSELFGGPATHKVGLKARIRDKESDRDRFRDRRSAADPGVPLTSFLRDIEARNYHYVLGRKHDPATVLAYYDSVRPNAPQRNITDGILSDYSSDEDIYAAYGMSEFRIGAVDMLAGLRLERTKLSARGFTFNDSTGAIGTSDASNTFTNWFPGVHLRYEASPDVIFRVSANRAISRAPFADLAPYRDEDPDDLTLALGNPELKPTLSNNLDVSLEYYLQPVGVLSVAAFYKDLKDYIFIARFNENVGGDNYRVTQPLNSPDGQIYGIEFNYQHTLGFLPEPFDGLGLFANHSISEARAALPDRSAKIRMPGLSKHTSNFGVYFERDRLSMQLSYNHRSEYIQEVDTIRGRDFDVYWDGRGQLDFTASYQATRNIQLYTQFNNLTNTKGYRYVGSPERNLEYEEFGWWVTFGTKFNF